MDYFNYARRRSSVAHIGNTPLGGDYPIRIQSMANVSTMDTEASVAQAIRMIEAGAEYVRFTAQGEREARNLGVIRRLLNEKGFTTPLVADIHFNPRAADAAAEEVEKVRINPGNYVDKVKTFSKLEYTDEEYAQELKKIEERFVPFLRICRENHTAIRIGVNHGSLSDRIMSRYGDTPEGIVESCMEFLRICVKEDFKDVVVSIKASNTVVMVRSVRLLVDAMEREGMRFPLHLGVTEAGGNRMGLIKSGMGIGGLLLEGIGDTLRVSLTGDPEDEVYAGYDILRAVGYAVAGPEIISCPTCGRTQYPMIEIANEVERRLKEEGFKKPVKIAIMGCIVNGPGEASDADIGIAGGKDCAVLFEHGEKIRTLKGDIVSQFVEEIHKL